MCGMAQGIPVLSVLHLQKDRCSKGQKICGSSSALPAGNNMRWARDVPARSVLHLQKTRCLEGAGKAALELDAACPSLTLFLFHVYSNASCGRQFQTSRRFFGPYKKQRGLRNSRSTPAGTAPRPSTQNLPSETPSRPFNQNPPSETPRAPSTRISSPRPPGPPAPPKLFLSFPDIHSSLQSLFFGKLLFDINTSPFLSTPSPLTFRLKTALLLQSLLFSLVRRATA